MKKPRVLVLRGHHANPWDLGPLEELGDRFDIACVTTRANLYDVRALRLENVRAYSIRDLLPRGRLDLGRFLPSDRYFGIRSELARADIVHAAEISHWLSAQAATQRGRRSFKLVLTVWETIPMLDTYRTSVARKRRRQVIAAGDLFLAATGRGRDALLLEGVPEEKILICPPGIDVERFAASHRQAPTREHRIISPGRLVWEKGHQDVLRAFAALKHGMVAGTQAEQVTAARLLIVGSGPEAGRLEAYSRELGVADTVEFRRAVPYDEMPELYASASCMVLASLPAATGAIPGGRPTFFWEEQFGMVLVEAMAAGLPVIASASGAIPEVVGPGGTFFASGDWLELARRLVEGPLSRPPGERVEHPPELVARYSRRAAAERITAAYDRVLSV